jgi:Methyltransferase domain
VHVTDIYVQYIMRYTKLFFPNQKVQSLVEFGNGGGYFSREFADILGPHNFITVEGTGAGIAKTIEHYKLSKDQVVQHDLRLPLFLGRRFDVAVCTEVVEHVEPPFSAQIVLTLIAHADVIWFSFQSLGLSNRAWINHPNERPLKMWKNLFDFYGYDIVMIPDTVTVQVAWRGNFIAYRRGNDKLLQVTEKELMDNKITETPK